MVQLYSQSFTQQKTAQTQIVEKCLIHLLQNHLVILKMLIMLHSFKIFKLFVFD
jgi:hypothetical protein